MSIRPAPYVPASGVSAVGAAEARSVETAPSVREGRYDTVEISAAARRRMDVSSYAANPYAALDALLEREADSLLSFGDAPPLYETVYRPEKPVRQSGESNEAWERREAGYQASASWSDQLGKWLKETDGWPSGERQRYLNDRSASWAGDLMRRSPAQFQQWLENDRALLASGHGEDCVLPEGFGKP